MEQNYYEILGITKNASKEEIRKSYLKLAAKYHPDIYKGEDKEIKFKNIKQAYETLYEERSRRQYDNYLNLNSKQSFQDYKHSQNTYFNQNHREFQTQDIFEQIFKDNDFQFDEQQFFNQSNNSEFFFFNFFNKPNIKLEDVRIDLNLNFLETAIGGSKDISFSQKIYCNNCKWWLKESCIKCNYKGYKEKKTNLNIRIPGGLNFKDQIKIEQHGNVFKNQYSDIILKLKPTFKLNNKIFLNEITRDIYHYIFLSVNEFLKAKTITVKDCFNELVTINLPKDYQPGTDIIIKNKGGIKTDRQSKGNYIFKILYSLDKERLLDLTKNNSELKDIFEFKSEIKIQHD